MKTGSIDKMAPSLHNLIESWRPSNITDLITLLKSELKQPFDFSIKKIYYMGYYQGLKVTLIDRQHRTRKQITPKGKVYWIS